MDTSCAGIYLNNTNGMALVSVLRPNGTCGMFMMPTPSSAYWLGFTTFAQVEDQIGFTIQNANPEKGAAGETEPAAGAGQGAEESKFIRATFYPKDKYVQHGGPNEAEFKLVTDELGYFEKLDFKSIGEARNLDSEADEDLSLEIKKVCVAYIDKFGGLFGY
jgi:hypothetical protein